MYREKDSALFVHFHMTDILYLTCYLMGLVMHRLAWLDGGCKTTDRVASGRDFGSR